MLNCSHISLSCSVADMKLRLSHINSVFPLHSEPMWPIEARNAAIANHCFTCAINRVGTVSQRPELQPSESTHAGYLSCDLRHTDSWVLHVWINSFIFQFNDIWYEQPFVQWLLVFKLQTTCFLNWRSTWQYTSLRVPGALLCRAVGNLCWSSDFICIVLFHTGTF